MNQKLFVSSLTVAVGGLDLFLGAHNLPPIASLSVTGADTVIDAIQRAKENFTGKKLENFVNETQQATDEERIEFLQRLDENPKKFQERVLLIIDRLDDEKKAKMLGKLCKAFILRQLDKNIFSRLAPVIERTYFDDLEFFYTRYQNRISDSRVRTSQELVEFELHEESKPMIGNLVNAGLIEPQQVGILQHGLNNSVVGHSPTSLGKALLKFGF